MAVLTNSGRSAVAKAIKTGAIHMAWGSGMSAWDTTPDPVSVNATSLVNEVGRRTVSQTMYCVPDAAGGIVVPNGRFSPSATPTKYLYLRFAFDNADSPAATIREVGVFTGTVAKPSVPIGQEYLVPSEVLTTGDLLVTERIQRLERSADIRQQFEFVIQF